jgi:pimeloyl-ACP methyl ester carboxylesterase
MAERQQANDTASAEEGWRSAFVHAQDGLRLHARDYGPAVSERLPVVCLAGLSRNSIDFHPLASALAAHRTRPRRVLALDYRGRGLSDRDPNWRNYDVRIEAADVLAVLDALGVAEAIFVGTSRGGLCTMALATMRPAVLRGAVLNDVGPVIEATGLLRIRATVGKLPPPRSLAEAADMLRRTSDARFSALAEEDWLALAAGSWREPAKSERVVDRPGMPLEPTFDPSIMKPLAELDLEAPMPPLWPLFQALVHLPLLAIRGENSDLLSAGTLAAMQAAHPACESHVVIGQGHAPLLRDAATIDRIAAFVGAAEDTPRRLPETASPQVAAPVE